MLLYKTTLSEALPLRTRPGAVGLILSLEGARYYVFLSRQSPDQVASSNLRSKLNLHHELAQKMKGVAAEQRTPLNTHVGQEKYQLLISAVRGVAALSHMEMDGRHAEEVLIERWGECVENFVVLRGRQPSRAEVFLTHCPCQLRNASPSPARVLAGVDYPKSCREKLHQFCSTGDRLSMKWKVYFDQAFGNGVPPLEETVGNLTICRRPDYIVFP